MSKHILLVFGPLLVVSSVASAQVPESDRPTGSGIPAIVAAVDWECRPARLPGSGANSGSPSMGISPPLQSPSAPGRDRLRLRFAVIEPDSRAEAGPGSSVSGASRVIGAWSYGGDCHHDVFGTLDAGGYLTVDGHRTGTAWEMTTSSYWYEPDLTNGEFRLHGTLTQSKDRELPLPAEIWIRGSCAPPGVVFVHVRGTTKDPDHQWQRDYSLRGQVSCGRVPSLPPEFTAQ
jgi:hypothetical protein